MPAEASGADRPPVTRPRPGHADLAGFVKYGHDDMRNVLERASARETAARVAVGAIARQLLARRRHRDRQPRRLASARPPSPIRWRSRSSEVARDRRRLAAALRRRRRRAADDRGDRSRRARPATRWAAASRSSRTACRPGLGSHVHWDRKLDGRLAQALMSIPAIKAVGIGRGPAVADAARLAGPRRDRRRAPARAPGAVPGVARPTNNAGGLEGGVTNGEDLRVTGYMKPIATLMKPLRSVDLDDDDREPGGDRAQRRLRRPGRGGRRRSDGRDRARRRARREVRRRLDRGAGRELAGLPASAPPRASPRDDHAHDKERRARRARRVQNLATLRAHSAESLCFRNHPRVAATLFACALPACPRTERLNALDRTNHRRRDRVSIDELGPGMLESAYEACLAFELHRAGPHD